MRKILLFIFILAANYSFGQASDGLAFPSANNTFLGKPEGGQGVDVDLYTGAARINIPICALNSTDINVPVSINYNGSKGIKVQDYATCVGLGWQLNAGGSISRVVRGFPDEYPNGYTGGLWGQKVTDWKTNNTPLPVEIAGANFGHSYPTADGEPDLFSVQTPMFNFQFVLNDYGIPVFSNNPGIEVIANYFYISSNYANASFVVKDEFGNQYFFGSSSASVEKNASTIYGSSYVFPTTWHLDKIITFNAKDSINFNYVSGFNQVSYHYQTIRTFRNPDCSFTDNTPSVTTIVGPKYISNIRSSNGMLTFGYSEDRSDFPNASKLTEIKSWGYDAVTTNFTNLQSYVFYQSYFGDPEDVNTLRLRLDKITVAGNSGSTATPVDMKTFTYNLNIPSPSRTTEHFDYWGYHNDIYIPANGADGFPMVETSLRKPDPVKCQVNILTSIMDISKGIWELEYELNSYYKTDISSNVNIGGLRVKNLKHKLTTGENLQTNYYYTDVNGNSTGQILTESYNILTNEWYPMGVFQVSSESPRNVFDINGDFIGYSSVKVSNPGGGYSIFEFNNFDDAPDEINYTSGFNANVRSLTSRAFKRGLLKKQSVFNSANVKLTEDINTYQALDNPFLRYSFGYNWGFAYTFCTNIVVTGGPSDYSTIVENYRLSQTTHRAYDVVNTSDYVQNTIQYTYTPNKKSVRSISTSSSKDPGNYNQVQTLYYADDASWPMINLTELTAKYALNSKGCKGVIMHQTNNSNGMMTEVHNSYEISPENSDKIYLVSTSEYRNGSLTNQQLFKYDAATSNMLSSYPSRSGPVSVQYGYYNAYPVARASNAAKGEIYYDSFEQPGSFDANSGITGEKKHSGRYSNIIVNAGPGEKFSYSTSWNTISLPAPKKFTYSGWIYSNGPSAQIFLFMYRGSAPPYHIDVDAVDCYETGKWVFIKKEFIVPSDVTHLSLRLDNNSAGTVWFDDVKLYPSDAQMVTYTYDPLVGVTGETDINNRLTKYEYDGMGRLSIVRDEDNNIIKRICYNLDGQVGTCSVNPEWVHAGASRCKMCPSNNAYYAGTTEYQQIDNNPNSLTYQQTRWVDSQTGTCNTETYQNTSTPLRCKKDALNNNTGEQEQEQRDMNPCSPTYNSTRWILAGANPGACPASDVYARVFYENQVYSGNTVYADVVVRFYADAGCTVPASVSGLYISYATNDPCGGVPDINPGALGASGDYLVLESFTIISYEFLFGDFCDRTFSLLPGAGFIIVN